MKTLVFLKTHFINDFVLNELKKLRACDTKNHKTLLFIDNHTNFLNLQNNGIKKMKFNGKEQECFLLDEFIFKEMNLPYYTNKVNNAGFSRLMWYCCDYPIYLIQKYYPDYDYYWQIESDVFMNGDNYKQFFQKFKSDDRDLIITNFMEIDLSKSPQYVPQTDDWIYKNKLRGAGYFPIVRISNNAAKICYKKRLEHIELFEKFKDNPSNEWVYCERFLCTECVLNGFKCGPLGEKNIRFLPEYDRYKDIPAQDGKIYHPVKSN